jgi:uncharacterized protein (UPF0128 family)
MSDDQLLQRIEILRGLAWVSLWHREQLEELEIQAAARGLKV